MLISVTGTTEGTFIGKNVVLGIGYGLVSFVSGRIGDGSVVGVEKCECK